MYLLLADRYIFLELKKGVAYMEMVASYFYKPQQEWPTYNKPAI